MIEIIRKKGANLIPLDIDDFKLNNQLTWVNVTSPSEEEINRLSVLLKIPKAELNESVSLKENPRVEYKEEYTQVLFKAATMKTTAQTNLTGIFIMKNTTVFIHKIEMETIPSAEVLAKNFMSQDNTFLLYNILMTMVQNFDIILDKIEDQIDLLEEKILNEVSIDYNKQSYRHKKSLIFLRKSLKNNVEVIKSLKRDYFKVFKDTSLFDDLLYDITRMMDLEEVNRDRLSEILNIYISTTSKKTNEIMKGLTILASIFAFPMLISGIYGMNFHYSSNAPTNMPEIYWEYGYLFSLGLMLVSILMTFLYIKYKKYI